MAPPTRALSPARFRENGPRPGDGVCRPKPENALARMTISGTKSNHRHGGVQNATPYLWAPLILGAGLCPPPPRSGSPGSVDVRRRLCGVASRSRHVGGGKVESRFLPRRRAAPRRCFRGRRGCPGATLGARPTIPAGRSCPATRDALVACAVRLGMPQTVAILDSTVEAAEGGSTELRLWGTDNTSMVRARDEDARSMRTQRRDPALSVETAGGFAAAGRGGIVRPPPPRRSIPRSAPKRERPPPARFEELGPGRASIAFVLEPSGSRQDAAIRFCMAEAGRRVDGQASRLRGMDETSMVKMGPDGRNGICSCAIRIPTDAGIFLSTETNSRAFSPCHQTRCHSIGIHRN